MRTALRTLTGSGAACMANYGCGFCHKPIMPSWCVASCRRIYTGPGHGLDYFHEHTNTTVLAMTQRVIASDLGCTKCSVAVHFISSHHDLSRLSSIIKIKFPGRDIDSQLSVHHRPWLAPNEKRMELRLQDMAAKSTEARRQRLLNCVDSVFGNWIKLYPVREELKQVRHRCTSTRQSRTQATWYERVESQPSSAVENTRYCSSVRVLQQSQETLAPRGLGFSLNSCRWTSVKLGQLITSFLAKSWMHAIELMHV